MDIEKLKKDLAEFAAERDWQKFHSPKNLAMALNVEAGELLELFQWLTEEQSGSPDAVTHARVAEEIADIQIYLIRLADRLNIDIERAVNRKMALNAEKYPVDLAHGNATKYSRRS